MKIVLLASLLLSGCASSSFGKSLNVGVGLAKVADQLTTDYAEARGAVERNPIVGSSQWRQVVIGSLGGGECDRDRAPVGAQGASRTGPCDQSRVDQSVECGGDPERAGGEEITMSEKDGGPAFPAMQRFEQFDEDRGKYVEHHLPEGGMTLRDWFAGKAMLAHINGSIARGLQWSPTAVAKEAYLQADALLAERAK